MGNDKLQDPDYDAFVRRIRKLINVDLACYKPEQMRRRLQALATRHGAANLTAFAELMERNPEALAAFKNFFTINVSEFMRDPPRWNDLAQKVLPTLFEQGGRRPLKVWSAGCSYGAEPYTLAILLQESKLGAGHAILATDIDETILARAQRGTGYLESDLRHLGAERRDRCFARQADGTYSLNDALRSSVRFRRHDLLTAVPERGLDLIICRNVVIYFTEDAKRTLYQRLYAALRPGGLLFVGGTEVVTGSRELGLESLSTSFYRKAPLRLPGAA